MATLSAIRTDLPAAFNVADSAICIGVGLLFRDMRRNEEEARPAALPPPPPVP